MDGGKTGRDHQGPVLTLVPPEDIPQPGPTPVADLMGVYRVCLQLRDLCQRHRGVGLAAVQAGIPWDLFVIRYGDGYGYFVDCLYEDVGGDPGVVVQSVEGCLSLRRPDGSYRAFRTARPARVRVRGRRLCDDAGLALTEFDETMTPPQSVGFQHEIDHCHGKTLETTGQEVFLW